MIQKIATAVLIGASLVIAACNTVEGAGKDLQSASNCVENEMEGRTCN